LIKSGRTRFKNLGDIIFVQKTKTIRYIFVKNKQDNV
jgi:hypothetical protein